MGLVSLNRKGTGLQHLNAFKRKYRVLQCPVKNVAKETAGSQGQTNKSLGKLAAVPYPVLGDDPLLQWSQRKHQSSWSPEIKVKQEVRESSGNGAQVKGCLEHKDPSCIRGQRVLFGHTEANSEIQTRHPGSGWREGRACSVHQEITSVQTAAACSTSLQQQALHTCFQTRS